MNFFPGADPLSWVVFIVGFGVGVCYAFDGWRATTQTTEFAKTARLTNLKYAIFGFFSTYVLADVKAFADGSSVTKAQLLLLYIDGFSLAAFGGVVLLAIFIKVASRSVFRSPEARFISSTYHPTLDYLFYGYNYYSANGEKVLAAAVQARENHLRKFWEAYVKQVSSAAAVAGKKRPLSPDSRKSAMVYILQTIAGVVRQYYPEKDNLKINANCMVAYAENQLPTELHEKICYAASAGPCRAYLALTEYANPDGKESFVLPVSADTDKLLIGAPKAFANNGWGVIDDTWKLPREVSQELRDYFKRKGFRSFASLSIIHEGDAVGIVNIESSKPCVFGEDAETREKVYTLLEPFTLLLGFIIAA